MTLAQFTEPKLLVPRLLSDRQDGAIAELSKRLESAGRITDATAFATAVMSHEVLASAVFDGVAYPLARGRGAKRLSFACGLAPSPIRWGVWNIRSVTVVFLFAVPLSQGAGYLSLILTLSAFTGDEISLSTLRRCTQPEEMFEIFKAVRLVRAGHRPRENDETTASLEQ